MRTPLTPQPSRPKVAPRNAVGTSRPSDHAAADATTKPKGEVRMKSRRFTRIIAMTSFALAIPVAVTAQNNAAQEKHAKHHQYKVVDLGTFGGPGSAVYTFQHALSARGAVVGGADTPDANPNPGCFNFFI